MSIVIKNQVEASERSADELDRELTIAHGRALLARDVEALMRLVVDLLGALNACVERMQEEAAQGNGFDESEARAIFDFYVRVERIAMRAAEFGRKVESWGIAIEGKEKFRESWRRLKAITCFSPDRVAESLAQIRRGQSKPLGEFADEISRDPQR
jgi:hypothetical protein